MQDPIVLTKSNPLLQAEDFSALRRQGIKNIENLGSDIWTDYNTSDPGITILEAVCYAITDLAYRTGFEIKDLLAPENLTEDTWKEIFYTARQILVNGPLTINDYRKIIIDVKGVRNAWLEPAKDYEVPVWIDYNYIQNSKNSDCSCDGDDDDFCYGDLSVPQKSEQELKNQKATQLEYFTREKDTLDQKIVALDTEIKALEDQINAEPNASKKLELAEKKEALSKQIKYSKKKSAGLGKVIEVLKVTDIIPSKIVEFEGLYNVMVEYEEDVLEEDMREKVREQVVNRLLRHRNLCEDFLSVNSVEYLDFGIGTSIVLEEYADPDHVLAQVFFTIFRYFTPSVSFYTIAQMLDKGYLVDEIFEGPGLKHGFIDNAELEKTDLFRDIRLSDIISEIADIKGIKAITYLHLPIHDISDPASGKNYFNEWVQFLKQQKKVGRIRPSLSRIVFCKERDFITYYVNKEKDRKPDRMLKLFGDMKALERRYKLEGHEKDLPVPSGEYMDLENYYPITYSLPVCYGVSDRAGLPHDADDKRKIQALQLRGYLLFFEQILASHLGQLNHLRDLFSFDDSVKQTYFSRVLLEIENLEDLLINHQNRDPNQVNQVIHDFAEVLQFITEDKKLFNNRRNKFLDHLLARFSEDLSEYEAVSRWLTPHRVEERMIADKSAILKNGEYYRISSDRGKGYDYSRSDFWDSYNVSGAERRVARLLGFKNVQRRSLVPEFLIIEDSIDMDLKPPSRKQNVNKEPLSRIRFVDPDDKEVTLLTSVDVKEGCCTELLINEILKYADERRYFIFQDEHKQRSRKTAGIVGTFWFELYDSTDPSNAVLIATGEKFDKREDREAAFKRLQYLLDLINDNEGLLLVEHLLLRPKFDEQRDEAGAPIDIKLLDVCLDECDLGKGIDEGTTPGLYRKKISRIPSDKCYDKHPWILEYLRKPGLTKPADQSMLFQETFTDGSDPVLLKFRHYDQMAERIRDLQEYGSEAINYKIVFNTDGDNELEADDVRYSIVLYGKKGITLARTEYIFNRKNKRLNPNDLVATEEIAKLIQYFSFSLFLYCKEDPCDHNEDPYSFRTTVLIPCWPKRLRDTTFRNLVEKTIQTEFPAHIHTRIIWLGMGEMLRFEKTYYGWLKEMSITEMPGYEKVNPLVEVLNTLQSCGVCEDDCS